MKFIAQPSPLTTLTSVEVAIVQHVASAFALAQGGIEAANQVARSYQPWSRPIRVGWRDDIGPYVSVAGCVVVWRPA